MFAEEFGVYQESTTMHGAVFHGFRRITNTDIQSYQRDLPMLSITLQMLSKRYQLKCLQNNTIQKRKLSKRQPVITNGINGNGRIEILVRGVATRNESSHLIRDWIRSLEFLLLGSPLPLRPTGSAYPSWAFLARLSRNNRKREATAKWIAS